MADPVARPFLVSDPSNPGGTMQDPTATAKPQATSFTSSNGLTTTGIMNPFGLTQNNPSMGFMGGAPASPTAPPSTPNWAPGVSTNAGSNGLDRYANAPSGSGAGQWYNGQWVPDQTAGANPLGDARRAGTANPTEQAPTEQPTAADNPYSPNPDTPGSMDNTLSGAGNTFNPTTNSMNTAPQTPGAPAAAPGQPPAIPNNLGTAGMFGPDAWQNGINISSGIGEGGQTINMPGNSRQWATGNTANTLAQKLGGTVVDQQLEGPGLGYSSPQKQLQFQNGKQLNAGLVADTYSRYGDDPTGYGQYLVNRDMTGNQQNYGDWAHAQPGFKINPNLANTGPGMGTFTADQQSQGPANASSQGLQNGMGLQGGQPGQGNPGGYGQFSQNQQGQYGPGGQGSQFFSQMAQLMPFLQMLGLGGGFGGQQAPQRPPRLPYPSGGHGGYPYYSRFA